MNTDKPGEFILFDGKDTGLLYEWDHNAKITIYDPSYENELGEMTWEEPLTFSELQDAIARCEANLLAEIEER